MAGKRALKLKCPICKKTVQAKAPEFPFCSDRCRLLDLGAWAEERYRIPGEPVPAEPTSDDDGALEKR